MRLTHGTEIRTREKHKVGPEEAHLQQRVLGRRGPAIYAQGALAWALTLDGINELSVRRWM